MLMMVKGQIVAVHIAWVRSAEVVEGLLLGMVVVSMIVIAVIGIVERRRARHLYSWWERDQSGRRVEIPRSTSRAKGSHRRRVSEDPWN